LNTTLKTYEAEQLVHEELKSEIVGIKIDQSLLDKTIFYLSAILLANSAFTPQEAFEELLNQLDRNNNTHKTDLKQSLDATKITAVDLKSSWTNIAFGILTTITSVFSKGAFISFGKIAKHLVGRGVFTKTVGRTAEVLGVVPVLGAIIEGVFLIKSVQDLQEKHAVIGQLDTAVQNLEETIPEFRNQLSIFDRYQNALIQASQLLQDAWKTSKNEN